MYTNNYVSLQHKRRHFNIECNFLSKRFTSVNNFDFSRYQSWIFFCPLPVGESALKGLAQAKIIKKSVILFRVLKGTGPG